MAEDAGLECPRCRAHNRTSSRFCEECGAALYATCLSCGVEVPRQKRYCGSCGAPNDGWTGEPLASIAVGKPTPAGTTVDGERKHVTVLFADLKGSTGLIEDRDPDEAQELLDSILERMFHAVHRYGGMANQVMGDGIMALFGAPLTHEDHAVRACFAALAIHDAMQRYTHERGSDS